jgi:exonuclease III
MSEALCPIVTWNPRGLNMPARRSAVAELAAAAKCSILCLQETKLSTIDSSLAMEIAGPSRKSFIFLPA